MGAACSAAQGTTRKQEGTTMSNNELAPISPGQYRMRNGNTAVVRYSDNTLSHSYYWVGSIGDTTDVWDRNGRYYINGEDSPLDLVARLPDESPADDRIERALRVLRNAARQDGLYGVFVAAEEVNEAVQILEGQGQ